MYCDWQGIRDLTLPERFNRTLMERDTPKWDFKQWVPDLVMVCLGLNDYSGLKGKDGIVPEEKSLAYRAEYRAFLARIRSVYPGVKILAVAAPPGWIRRNVGQVVAAQSPPVAPASVISAASAFAPPVPAPPVPAMVPAPVPVPQPAQR